VANLDDSTAIARAARALEAGEIVCYPTESTYGLAVDATSPVALERLVRLKGRDPRAPFGLVAGDRAAARAMASVWPDAAERLASRHWPGPLTLVLPAVEGAAPELIGPYGVGVRVSAHPIARGLAAALGRPITATSANRSAEPAAVVVDEARRAFGDRVAIYLDGGVCAGTPSTVVGVRENGELVLIRSGAVVLSGLTRA
jgi:L-threonylcarbamoyladenylate synthase